MGGEINCHLDLDGGPMGATVDGASWCAEFEQKWCSRMVLCWFSGVNESCDVIELTLWLCEWYGWREYWVRCARCALVLIEFLWFRRYRG